MGAVIKRLLAILGTSEKGRKIIGAALLTPIILGLIAVTAFIFIVSGLFDTVFGAITDTAVNQSWTDLRKYVEAALSGVNNTITTEIKEKTYEFMPDFSINLSKSVLQKTFSEGNSSFLLTMITPGIKQLTNTQVNTVIWDMMCT